MPQYLSAREETRNAEPLTQIEMSAHRNKTTASIDTDTATVPCNHLNDKICLINSAKRPNQAIMTSRKELKIS